MDHPTFQHRTAVDCGPDALSRLGEQASATGEPSVMPVWDPGIVAAGLDVYGS